MQRWINTTVFLTHSIISKLELWPARDLNFAFWMVLRDYFEYHQKPWFSGKVKTAFLGLGLARELEFRFVYTKFIRFQDVIDDRFWGLLGPAARFVMYELAVGPIISKSLKMSLTCIWHGLGRAKLILPKMSPKCPKNVFGN